MIIIFITKNECIENLKSDLVNDANAEFHGSMETTWSPTLKHCSVYFFSRNGGMSIPLSVNSTNLYSINHYSDVIMARWCLKSPASRSFTQRFNQVQIKENIKAPQFLRRIHRGPVNSPQKWPVTRKMFRLDDVIMEIKIVGVSLDDRLNFNSHVTDIYNGASRQINSFTRFSKYPKIDRRLSVYKSFIQSKFS